MGMEKFRLNKYNTLNWMAYFVFAVQIFFLLASVYMFGVYPVVCKEYLCALDPYFFTIGFFFIFFCLIVLFLLGFGLEFILYKRGKLKPHSEIQPIQSFLFKLSVGFLCFDFLAWVIFSLFVIYLMYHYA